jgi:signal transduction histidine kinase
MVNADDEGRPRGPYALGMELLRRLRARARGIDPLRADLLLAALFAVESQLELALLRGEGAEHVWLASVCLLAMAVGLALRRVQPLGAALLTTAAFTAGQSLGRPINENLYSLFFVLLFVLYSAGRHEEGRRLVVAGVATWALSLVGTLVDGYPTGFTDVTFAPLVTALGPIALGRFIRHRAELNERLRLKAETLWRERAAQAERAAAEERTRIAGELHDVVAHAMSAMVVQAAGARRLTHKDPARARDAFGTVEETGREALTEIRRLLGVLRRDDEEIALAPQPSLRHLAALVARARAAGLPVDLEVEGDERLLPAGVDLTAYRLVQEALNGAVEEGDAGSAQVVVRYRPDGVDIEVLDDGAAGDGQRRLAGARERVALYGGQLQAGRRREGGHAVRARLPVGGAA